MWYLRNPPSFCISKERKSLTVLFFCAGLNFAQPLNRCVGQGRFIVQNLRRSPQSLQFCLRGFRCWNSFNFLMVCEQKSDFRHHFSKLCGSQKLYVPLLIRPVVCIKQVGNYVPQKAKKNSTKG